MPAKVASANNKAAIASFGIRNAAFTRKRKICVLLQGNRDEGHVGVLHQLRCVMTELIQVYYRFVIARKNCPADNGIPFIRIGRIPKVFAWRVHAGTFSSADHRS